MFKGRLGEFCVENPVSSVTRIALRTALLALLCTLFSGCSFINAELNNRGGYLDEKGDQYFMIADTKPMRVLRAYVLLGSVTRLAQTKYESEREVIVRHVNSAIKVASDTYYCAYSQPGQCVYFDERMVELEIAVLRLLVAVTTSEDDDDLFEAVNKQVLKAVPLLKPVDSLSKLVDVVASTADAAAIASKTIQSVMQFAQSYYFKGRRLGALYRDSIELNMIAALTSLDTICAIKTGVYPNYHTASRTLTLRADRHLTADEYWALTNYYGDANELPEGACQSFRSGFRLWQRGAGNLEAWKEFLSNEASHFRAHIVPREVAFIQASDLIWRACEHLTSSLEQISECIGRRRSEELKNRKVNQENECAITFDRDGYNIETQAADFVNDKKKKALPLSDRCRLILFHKVVELRARRRAKSDTHIYWLSNVTPSPSHPLHRHPGQRDAYVQY